MVQVIQKYTDVFVPYNKIREEVLEVVEFMKKLKSVRNFACSYIKLFQIVYINLI